MTLTKQQQNLVNEAIQLESEYGKGNVFLRYVNDYFKVQFLIHIKNSNTVEFKLSHTNKPNMRILNGLKEKGLLTCCDFEHNPNVDSNDRNIKVIGSRILTELIEI